MTQPGRGQFFLLSIALSNGFVPPLCSHQFLQPEGFCSSIPSFPAFGLPEDGISSWMDPEFFLGSLEGGDEGPFPGCW